VFQHPLNGVNSNDVEWLCTASRGNTRHTWYN